MRTMKEKVKIGAGAAGTALAAYENLKGFGGDEMETDVIDLIADLLHYAEREGATPGEVASLPFTALDHYEYERDPTNAEEMV